MSRVELPPPEGWLSPPLLTTGLALALIGVIALSVALGYLIGFRLGKRYAWRLARSVRPSLPTRPIDPEGDTWRPPG